VISIKYNNNDITLQQAVNAQTFSLLHSLFKSFAIYLLTTIQYNNNNIFPAHFCFFTAN